MMDFEVQLHVAALKGLIRGAENDGLDRVQLDLLRPHVAALADLTGLTSRLNEHAALMAKAQGQEPAE